MIPHALAANIVINPNLPYVSNPSNIGSLIEGFYLFALSLAGIMAFGAIVYGGIRYAAGRGNPSAESTGKSWITNALLGLLLLGGAYVILQTVNPALTTLGIPGLPHLNSATVLGFNSPVGSLTTWGCVAPDGKVACVAANVSTTDSQCKTTQGCQAGAPCLSVPTSDCGLALNSVTAGPNWTYGCLAPDNKYACVTSTQAQTDSGCTTAVGCGGNKCIQIQKTSCGKNTAQAYAVGGALGATCSPSQTSPPPCMSPLKCCPVTGGGGAFGGVPTVIGNFCEPTSTSCP